MGSRARHRHGGRAERVEVVLLEMLAEKPIGDGKFHARVVRVQDPQGADPGVHDLGRELPVQRRQKLLVQIVPYDWAFLRARVTHTLIHGGG
jgi:hypothetical protein